MPSVFDGHDGAGSALLQIVADVSVPVLALTSVSEAASPVWPTVEFVGNVGVTDIPTPACAAAGASTAQTTSVAQVDAQRDALTDARFGPSDSISPSSCPDAAHWRADKRLAHYPHRSPYAFRKRRSYK